MAGSFNKVILMGNIVKDPELRYTPQGTAVTDIRMAVNDPRKKGEKDVAVFVDVTLWEKQAEAVCEYLRKGRPILVEGRIAADTWDDKETGKKLTKLKVVAHSFQFVDSREAIDQAQDESRGNTTQRNAAPAADNSEIPF